MTYSHGRPITAGASLSAMVESPRASAQVFYQFDDLFHDNAIFSPHPTFSVGTGDLDTDGDIDLADWALLFDCITGPNNTIMNLDACAPADFDGDKDIDLADFAGFTSAFTGPL